jgi:hypothetical protein
VGGAAVQQRAGAAGGVHPSGNAACSASNGAVVDQRAVHKIDAVSALARSRDQRLIAALAAGDRAAVGDGDRCAVAQNAGSAGHVARIGSGVPTFGIANDGQIAAAKGQARARRGARCGVGAGQRESPGVDRHRIGQGWKCRRVRNDDVVCQRDCVGGVGVRIGLVDRGAEFSLGGDVEIRRRSRRGCGHRKHGEGRTPEPIAWQDGEARWRAGRSASRIDQEIALGAIAQAVSLDSRHIVIVFPRHSAGRTPAPTRHGKDQLHDDVSASRRIAPKLPRERGVVFQENSVRITKVVCFVRRLATVLRRQQMPVSSVSCDFLEHAERPSDFAAGPALLA